MERKAVVTVLVALAISAVLFVGGCGGSSGSKFSDDFSNPMLIDNPWFPLEPGTT